MQISLPESRKSYQDTTPVERGGRRLREFVAKFNHDWMMLSAAGLAYSLMIAVVPFGIAILAVLGLTLGNLNPQVQAQLVQQIKHAFPSAISSQNVLQPAITRLNQSAGFLAVLAVVTAIFGGSRLFIAIERCFDIVYRTYPRKTIPQYVMALLMMLVFIVLTPIMVLASSLPAVILSLIQSSVLSQVPFIIQLAHNSLVLSASSLLGGVIVGWMLFQATYMAVPNLRISFKRSWRGALVAAVLLEIFLVLFPFYITHFMSSYTGVAGFAVIFLLFFYYFAMILLLGAQINAYFAEGVSPLPATLATVLRDAVGRNSSEPAAQDKLSQATALNPPQFASHSSNLTNVSTLTASPQGQQTQTSASTPRKRTRATGSVAQAIAGTALAFTATMIRLRKKNGH
jgi:YihY family inner membrane protein